MGKRVILGDRPPSFTSKSTLALELDISESTVDSYVQRGLLPRPIQIGGAVRWNWDEVVASLKAQASGSHDPFMKGIDHV
jgi:predicted DNA-binding transcriptional regulator AlpA